jgi:hypothetical protein
VIIRIAAEISDRLRRLFGDDVGEWPAARADDIIRDQPAETYRGISLGRPAGRRGRHRE